MADQLTERHLNSQALHDFIVEQGLAFKDRPHSYILWCPRCEKQKWYVRKRDGFSKCFHCGPDFKGHVDRTLAIATGRKRSELSELFYGISAPDGTGPDLIELDVVDHWSEWSDYEPDDNLELPPELYAPPGFVDLDSRHGAPGLAYLESRGVSLALAKEHGVRYYPAQNRVIFPIVVEGELRGWQARYIHPTDYYNPAGERVTIPKIVTTGEVGGKVLMFQDRLRASGHAVLVEGPMDAIKCHLCGGNVASMGKGVTAAQLDIFLRYGVRKLYLGLDPDAADDVMRIMREMSRHDDLTLYRLEPPPGRDDLGDATPEEVLEQFRLARPIEPGQAFIYDIGLPDYSVAW